MRRLTIAIDGPGSSGKGTVARGVAAALGYQYIDTGAMYRSVALIAQQRGIAWSNEEQLTTLAASLKFEFSFDGDQLRVYVAGTDVTQVIRTSEIGQGASAVSTLAGVRGALLRLQQELGAQGGVVMDGRDIGTVILPKADLKIFLDADLSVRAHRRYKELIQRGEDVTLAGVESALAARDSQDSSRTIAPLKKAEDAVVIDSTNLDIPDAIALVLKYAKQQMGPPSQTAH